MKRVVLSLLASVALGGPAYADLLSAPQTSNNVPVDFTVGAPVVGGPVQSAFSITASLAGNTLIVAQSALTTPIPTGTVISGSGVTPATVTGPLCQTVNNSGVTSTFCQNNQYTVSGSPQTVAAQAMTATPGVPVAIQDAVQLGAPTYVSGGCATTPAFAAGSSPYSWSLTNGASGCASNSTIVLSFPAAAHGYHCTASDLTTNTHAIFETAVAAIASGRQSITLTDYSRTAGTAQTMIASDVIVGSCSGY